MPILKWRKDESSEFVPVGTYVPTAEEIGARPDTWMPTLKDIGAAQHYDNLFTSGGIDHSAKLSSAGWYRICAANVYTTVFLHLAHNYNSGTPADIYAIVTCNHRTSKITIVNAAGWYNNNASIDDLRLTYDETADTFYVDMHYALSVTNTVNANIMVSYPRNPKPAFERMSLTPVADAPTGETVLCYADWQNPPMKLGQEYRTTERFNGKPVYVKLVETGYLGAGNTVQYQILPAGHYLIDWYGTCASGSRHFPYWTNANNSGATPKIFTNEDSTIGELLSTWVSIDCANINLSTYKAQILVKYWKSGE